MVMVTSRSTLQPSSVATYSAVSKSMVSLMEAMTPLRRRALMTSAAVFFMRLASSATTISSGIFTVSGVFLMTSIRKRRIFSCSSERALLLWNFPPFLLLLLLLPIFCLPPVIFWIRSETRVSTRSSNRAELTCTAEVSTTRRSRLRSGSAGLGSGLGAAAAAGAGVLAAAGLALTGAAALGVSFAGLASGCLAAAKTCSREPI